MDNTPPVSNSNDLLGDTTNSVMDLLSGPTNTAQNTGGLLDTNQIQSNNVNDLLGGSNDLLG